MLTKTDGGAAQVLAELSKALSAGDVEAAVNLFAEKCFWRDLVTFTWNLKTMEGKDAIRHMLSDQLAATRPSQWALAQDEPVVVKGEVVEAWFTFETNVARGDGHLRLKEGKIFTLLTAMRELIGHEETIKTHRPLGAKHGQQKHPRSWKDEHDGLESSLGTEQQPYAVIIGGGQGGIALGARLKQLGVPTIIVEKNARAGDSWRNRYKTLCLHDPVWYDHLPYLDFPESWPVFAPKDKLGDFLEMYVSVMELTYWTGAVVSHAQFDEETKTWNVTVERDGKTVALQPKQLIFATGMSGHPHVPDFPGMDQFKGNQHHSSDHPGPDPFKGKRVVVIGSNNSAHDIAAALWAEDIDVTMVQRSPTHVVRSETLMELGLGPLYSEEALAKGITTHRADMVFASEPYAIMHEGQIRLHNAIRARDAQFYERLAKSGFQLTWGEDEAGIQMLYLRRGSGYYIDVGASDLIASGEIKLAHGQVSAIEEDAIVLEDGTRLYADVVVYATGYGSMNAFVADLIGRDAADKVGKVWGLGSGTRKDPGPWEGEPRNMWKPTHQESLWFHGGNLHQSRHYSLYLALQVKARMEGIETPVYGMPPVHHRS
ncbi:MAG: NAD(P)/FAD-dependent oxidoreductase [Pseudomonadota bacterium]